jgi:hypothetical protein
MSACGLTTNLVAAEPLTNTKTLIADALSQDASPTTYHMVISYDQGSQVDVQADLHVRVPSDAVGTFTENGNTANFIQTDGSEYLQGKDFISEYGGSNEGALFGDRWVIVTSSLLKSPLVDLGTLTSLPSYFLNIDFTGKRVDHVPAATESTAELESSWGNLYITELPPHRLVKVETKNGFVASGGLSNVNFELLEFGDAVDVKAPVGYANLADPTTLPPDYQLAASWKWGTCIYSIECGFSGTVKNLGGTYTAPASTYTFNLYSYPNRRFLGRCGGAIRVVQTQKTVGIGCMVTSSGFKSYTGHEVSGEVVIDNPAYDG